MSFEYLRAEQEKNLVDFPVHFKQNFRRNFSPSSVSKQTIINMKNAGTITDRDLKIALFLFRHTFATATQIYRHFGGEYEYQSIKNRLETLVQYSVVNVFWLGEETSESFQRDALMIYCLDFGGKILVTNFTNEDTLNWQSGVNSRSSSRIGYELMVNEFYLSVLETCPEKMLFFRKNPSMRAKAGNGFVNFEPSFEMALEEDFEKRYFVGQVVTKEEVHMSFRDKMINMEPLFTTYTWKKYYGDVDKPPVLFVIGEDDLTAKNAGRAISTSTDIDLYRFTTLERMKRPLHEKGAFLKYVEEANALKEIILAIMEPN